MAWAPNDPKLSTVAVGKVKGFAPDGRPLFGGPPFWDADRYWAIVDFWQAHKVMRGARPWWNPTGTPAKFYGPDQARADLEAYAPKFAAGFARRRAYLPADAWFMWDKYGTERVDDWSFAAGGFGPVATDEYGRRAAGKSSNILETITSYAPILAPLIPGWGPVIVAALALAQGKELDDAILAGIKAQIPGGPMAGIAFDFGVAIALGEPVDKAAIQSLLKSSPEAAAAYELARLAMGSSSVDQAALGYLQSAYPGMAPVIAEAQKHGNEPAQKHALGQLPVTIRNALMGKAGKTPAPLVLVPIVVLDPVVRAHRAIVPESERSWWIAGASVGLVPVGVVLGRLLGKLAASRGWA